LSSGASKRGFAPLPKLYTPSPFKERGAGGEVGGVGAYLGRRKGAII